MQLGSGCPSAEQRCESPAGVSQGAERFVKLDHHTPSARNPPRVSSGFRAQPREPITLGKRPAVCYQTMLSRATLSAARVSVNCCLGARGARCVLREVSGSVCRLARRRCVLDWLPLGAFAWKLQGAGPVAPARGWIAWKLRGTLLCVVWLTRLACCRH
jgi:hypothetical protein